MLSWVSTTLIQASTACGVSNQTASLPLLLPSFGQVTIYCWVDRRPRVASGDRPNLNSNLRTTRTTPMASTLTTQPSAHFMTQLHVSCHIVLSKCWPSAALTIHQHQLLLVCSIFIQLVTFSRTPDKPPNVNKCTCGNCRFKTLQTCQIISMQIIFQRSYNSMLNT